MKKTLIMLILLILTAATSMAQMEEGDKEVQFAGSFYTAKSASMINLIVVGGYYIKHNIQVGVGPTISYMSAGFLSYTTIGATFFG